MTISPWEQQMQGDLAQALELYGESVTVWPAGVEANARAITVVIMGETRESIFLDRPRALDHDEMVVEFSSRGDVEGIVAPLERARGGAGDIFIIDATSWYLKRLLRDGRRGGGMHQALLSTSPNPNA